MRHEVRRLRAAATHRVSRPGSAAARAFGAAQLAAADRLQRARPYLQLEEARRHFRRMESE